MKIVNTHKKITTDMLLLSVPYADFSYPPCGPAVLKGIAESQGYSITCRDFGVDFVDFIKQYPGLDATTVMTTWLNDFDHTHEYYELIDKFYKYCVAEIQKYQTRFLGISVFSVYHHRFAFDLCQRLRAVAPDLEIVIGGKGISVRYGAGIEKLLTGTEKFLEYHQIMKKRKLIDYAVIGDAEDAIIDLLAGRFQRDNNDRQTPSIKDLNYPFSNFDDYDIARYGAASMGFIQLPVVSSKGCVRACDFCDVGAHFVRFQSKDGNRLVEEMIYLSEKYKIYSFALQDSIANGNMKALTQMCERLAEYNQSVDPERRIRWAANWIARPPNSVKPHFFDLMKAAGCESLVIGAESGSNYVLEHMRKKTTVEGLFYEIEQMDRCGIPVNINLILGHWSERWQDFVDSLDMTLKLAYYEAKGIVTGFQIGGGFHALENTPAADYNYSGIVKNDSNWEIMWWSDKNPELTAKVRFSRLYIFWHMAYAFNIGRYYEVFSSGNVELLPLVIALQQSRDEWKKFYAPLIPTDFKATCPSIHMINQADQFITDRLVNLYPKTTIDVSLDVSSCNGDPEFYCEYNGKEIYAAAMPHGQHTVSVDVNYDYQVIDHEFVFGMRGKNLNTDTQVDDQGNIVRDKKIMINSLIIDGIDVVDHQTLFYEQSVYTEEGQVIDIARPGFYKNSSIAWRFQAPFWRKVLKSRNAPKFYSADYNVHNELQQSLRQEIELMPY
jgi:radical SAM superfamily enzyme YgiQ (UPF0313 family)